MVPSRKGRHLFYTYYAEKLPLKGGKMKTSCCFIGHRKITDKELVFVAVKRTVQRLILEKGVKTFHFGSKSEFDDICHLVVSELQNKYPDIVRINYNCKSEYPVKPNEKADLQENLRRLLKKDIRLKDYESSKISNRTINAGKASYVERNQDMIDDSDYCVFFYTQEYGLTQDGTSSGTKLAYDYAVRKKKTILNIADTPLKEGGDNEHGEYERAKRDSIPPEHREIVLFDEAHQHFDTHHRHGEGYEEPQE